MVFGKGSFDLKLVWSGLYIFSRNKGPFRVWWGIEINTVRLICWVGGIDQFLDLGRRAALWTQGLSPPAQVKKLILVKVKLQASAIWNMLPGSR